MNTACALLWWSHKVAWTLPVCKCMCVCVCVCVCHCVCVCVHFMCHVGLDSWTKDSCTEVTEEHCWETVQHSCNVHLPYSCPYLTVPVICSAGDLLLSLLLMKLFRVRTRVVILTQTLTTTLFKWCTQWIDQQSMVRKKHSQLCLGEVYTARLPTVLPTWTQCVVSTMFCA